MSRKCSGACGLMSGMTIRSGSSNTGFTGMSPAIILQNRQSRMRCPAADDRAWDVLQVVSNFHHVQSVDAAHQIGHAVVLPAAELHDEMPARRELRHGSLEH